MALTYGVERATPAAMPEPVPAAGDRERRRPGDWSREEGTRRSLRGAELRLLTLLGVPSFALALSITVVTTYLPVQLQTGRASTTTIGLLIGTEGLMALSLPLIVGPWSDRKQRPLGGRLPFVLAATPVIGLALAAMGLVTSVALAAPLLVVFFAAYFVAYEPYRALYPDLVEDEIAGRAQSTQAIFRGLGTVLAIIGGGLLLSLAGAVAFVVAALVATFSLGGFSLAMARRGPPRARPSRARSAGDQARRLKWLLVDRPELRGYLLANALWELSLGALKTFVVLYLTVGLGFRLVDSVLIVGGVALLVLGVAAVSGTLADRYGRVRVIERASLLYGASLLVPFLVTWRPAIVVATPLIAVGAGTVMTLPYALLIPLMGDDEHGTLTGFYSFSRGIGTALGPLLAGTAISLSSGIFSSTHGYQATWGVCSAAVLLSIVPLRRLRRTAGA